MQEQIKFKLSDNILKAEVLDTATLNKELQHQLKAVEALLVGYHFKSRGRVFGLAINPESVQLLSQSIAKFTVHYSIGQFNACADVDYSERSTMEVLLDIDVEAGHGILTGEYFPEREPDEL
jgi:hypothetical protein